MFALEKQEILKRKKKLNFCHTQLNQFSFLNRRSISNKKRLLNNDYIVDESDIFSDFQERAKKL